MKSTITTADSMGVRPGEYVELSGMSSGEDRKPRFTVWTSKFRWYYLTWRPWFLKFKRRPIYLVTSVKSATELEIES
jgi:hypothetical protein